MPTEKKFTYFDLGLTIVLTLLALFNFFESNIIASIEAYKKQKELEFIRLGDTASEANKSTEKANQKIEELKANYIHY